MRKQNHSVDILYQSIYNELARWENRSPQCPKISLKLRSMEYRFLSSSGLKVVVVRLLSVGSLVSREKGGFEQSASFER